MAQYKKRNYEISIWTLQDEFITVLKQSNIDNKGQITDGKVNIRDDGTLELSFSIPMYYYDGSKRIENPIWYTTQNGIIIQDMRKIKLIFNKSTDKEKVFEFLITKVGEEHKNDTLICLVNAEGLIFNELGKWGYKISLSTDEFYARDYEYFTTGEWEDNNGIKYDEAPHGTLQYWLNYFLTPLPVNLEELDRTKWYYTIEMDWSSHNINRDSNKIYEDEYTGSWEDNGSNYIPKEIVAEKEKERMVDLEESNAYNLTQNLAETFGVFCRYEYIYDNTYHIIGRKIIFYNNYMRENEGYIDLTYPYSTSAITRERDSKDLTTKMFVRPITDDTSASGLITILDVAANKSKEDYLLNFDYLRLVNGITEEQYEEVNKYQYQIGQYNSLIKSLEEPLIALRGRVPELEAAITLHTNAIQLDKERISACNDLLNNLDKKDGEVDGTISIGPLAPRTAVLLQSSNSDNNGAYYINLTDHGVVLETLHIYRNYNFVEKTPSTELLTGTPEYDEFGNIIKINNLYITDSTSRTVYLTYNYIPKLYYDRVLKTWQNRLGTDEAALAAATTELTSIQERIEKLQIQYDDNLAEKRQLVANFDKMLGPALRESYWQPEDYKDHGDNYIDVFAFSTDTSTEIVGTSGYTELLWDDVLFDDEQKNTYEYTAAQITQYYPCIKLGAHLDYIKQHVKELSFMFYDYIPAYPTGRDLHNIRNFPVGSLCQYGFVKNGNTVEPVLILTGAGSMSAEQIALMKETSHAPKIGVIATTVTDSGITTTISSSIDVTSNMWLAAGTTVYPRIKINSLALKTSKDMLGLTYNNIALKNYEDYYILIRDNTTLKPDDTIDISNAAYYITIKPQALLKEGTITAPIKIKYNLSNADTAIYLDAIQVLKENAYPKVSYTIDPSVIDEDFSYELYSQLNRICNINDTDLKLENIQGYISELELDLDQQENDHIEIKNYKTKFEDLFTSIVAQTEAMKKSAYTIGLAANAFTSSGEIDAEILQNSVMKVDLNYAFNNGKLTIDEKNGIWGISDSGVVAFRGGGIFTATEKDSAGNWKWNTGIVPQGINANLISTGQLDTNRINIFAGDRVRFQLNGNGLFAYKSFFEDFNIFTLSQNALQKIDNASNRVDDLDIAQYVVMNQNGLFLMGEQGALVLNADKTDYITLPQTIKRVEISWDGLKLRNWENVQVFWADPDTGNLYLSGTIFADEFKVLDTREELGNEALTLEDWINSKIGSLPSIDDDLQELSDRVDELLGEVNDAIGNIDEIIAGNTTILNEFKEDIITEFTPNTTRGPNHNIKFKPGDIWEVAPSPTSLDSEVTATYVAITSWDQVYSEQILGIIEKIDNEENLTSNEQSTLNVATQSLSGWVATHDYRLAAITGAKLSIDAESGLIDVLAQNTININSGKKIYIAANENVDIVGNREVNIGGTTINIASSDNSADNLGGIHLVATKYDKTNLTGYSGTSVIDITPEGIELASKNGINIKSGAGINIKSSTKSDVSVIMIDNQRGLWLGSTQKISLFSSAGNEEEDISSKSSSAAAVEISPTRLIFGVSSTGNTTVTEMTDKYIVFGAAGKGASGTENITELRSDNPNWNPDPLTQTSLYNNPVTGVKITDSGIWMATGAGTSRSLISITPTELLLGTVTTNNSNIGSFIKLNQNEMVIGSNTNLYINTNNIALSSSSSYFRLGGPADADAKLLYSQGKLTVRGDIIASSFIVNGNEYDLEQMSNDIDAALQQGGGEGSGSKWVTGTTAPSVSTSAVAVEIGDMYLNTANGDVYQCTRAGTQIKNASWSYKTNIKGTSGSKWYSGTAMTNTGSTSFIPSGTSISYAYVGDMYLNTGTGNVYTCVEQGIDGSAKWKLTGNIKGAQGQAGAQGVPGTPGASGNKWYTGTEISGTSTNPVTFSGLSDVIVGDMYLNTSTGNVYRCTSIVSTGYARWVYQNTIKGDPGAKGDPGVNGNKWYYGTVMNILSGAQTYPSANISAAYIGDMYLNTNTYNVFRCSEAGNASTAKWIYMVNIKGSTGATGPAGAAGLSITQVTPLYYLSTSEPSSPNSSTTIYSTDVKNRWTTIVPTYQTNYNYYRCEQYTFSDASKKWSTPYIDYGLTIANATATSASDAATYAASAAEPFITNGLSSGTWNGVNYGLILGNTSTSKPMLIGSNSGITIAKSATASAGAAVVIDKSGIALNAATINLKANSQDATSVISLSPTAVTIGSSATVSIGASNNSITLNTNGLTIKATKFQMLDANNRLQDMWGRNDIIIMNPNAGTNDSWRRSVSKIETKMSGKHDWVLIRPYYDAECTYSTSSTFITGNSTTDTGMLLQQGTGQIAFGDDSNYYKYTVSFRSKARGQGSTGVTFQIYLSNNIKFPSSETITCTSGSKAIYAADYVLVECPAVTSSGQDKINLCKEGAQVYAKITDNSGDDFEVIGLKVFCQTDSTTSRVPCTVYYYP